MDRYHDLSIVSNDLIQKFQEIRAIRTVTQISPNGRALENGIYTTDNNCACIGPFVKPDGSVMQCNCPDATCYGNVNDIEFDLSDADFVGMCMREIEKDWS